LRLQTVQLGAVLCEDFSVTGEVGGLEGGGLGFAVERPLELLEEILALRGI
jgi:hypothetical protein